MIRWFLLQNRAGRTRLSKYYVPLSDQQKRKSEYEVFRTLSARESKWSNIAEVLIDAVSCMPCLATFMLQWCGASA